MKILKHLSDSFIRRVPVRNKLLGIKDYDYTTPELSFTDHVATRFEVNLVADLVGPIEANHELRKRAVYMFQQELYGEVVTELRELLRDLYLEDSYRGPDDPVLARIRNLEQKLTGINL